MRTRLGGLLILALLAAIPSSVGAVNPLPPYHAEVSFPSQPLPWTPEVAVDFGALLKGLGAATELDPDSVRVVGTDGEMLPTRFLPDKGSASRGLVRWNVPGRPKKGGQQKFRIHFAARSDQTWPSMRSEQVGEANLMPNGGVEQLDAAGTRPARWVYAKTIEIVRDQGLARSGECVVKVLPRKRPKTDRWQNGIRTPGIPGVIVEPKRGYRFRFWRRSEGCKGPLVSAAQVYWYDGNKKYIKHENFGGLRRGHEEWREVAYATQAPDNARYAMFVVNFYSSSGVLYLDDFSITPTLVKQINAARHEGGRQVRLGASAASVRRFDFGQDDSATWPGFASVTRDTEYTKERGFGWVGRFRPPGTRRPLPDDLARDFVAYRPWCQLAVDLPDGEYVAWFLIGDSGVGAGIIPTWVDWSIRVGRKQVLSYKPDPKTWYERVVFRHIEERWQPGIDVYDRFIAPAFEEKRVRFTAKGGQVRFGIRNCPLCALIVCPVGQEQELEEELAHIRAARKRSAPVRYDPPPEEQPAALSDGDKRRGYAVFVRDPAKSVYPGSAPQEGENLQKLIGFASQAEYEPFTFSIYPLRDLGTVHVGVSDLKTPEGGSIASQAIHVGAGRYVEAMRGSQEYRYTIIPGPIEDRSESLIPKGMTTRWWLRLRVPDDAGAGVYQGTVRIAPEKAPATELALAVRVLPFRLGPTPITAGLYHFDRTYWYIYWWRKAFEGRDEWLRKETFRHETEDIRLLKSFGLNSLAFCDDVRTQARVDADGTMHLPDDHRFVLWMDNYAKEGMGPMPWYGFSAMGTRYIAAGLYGHKLKQFSPEWERAYRSIIGWAKEKEKERGWPEVVMYLSDELSNHGATGAEKGRRLVELTKPIPGIRTVSSMNGPWESVMLPGLDIAMPNHAFPITAETVAKIKENRCELWFYNIGNDRVVWGLYPWHTGAKGRFQWFHRYAITNPWNAFDGYSRYSVTWVTPEGALPTPKLHQISEGIDDLRYVKALEDALAEARKSAKPEATRAADEAEKDLAELRVLLPDDVRLLIGVMDPKEAGKPAIGNFAKSRYLDRWRWILADHILKIRQALGD